MIGLYRLFASLVLAVASVGTSFATDYTLNAPIATGSPIMTFYSGEAFAFDPHGQGPLPANGVFTDTITFMSSSTGQIRITGVNGLTFLTATMSDNSSFVASTGSFDWYSPSHMASVLTGQVANANTLYTLTITAQLYDFYPPIPNLIGSYMVDFAGAPVAAVPEPGTFAMLLAGLGLMGMVIRRRSVPVFTA